MAEPVRIDLNQNDTGPSLELHVLRQHPTMGPTALDLTGASVVFQMRLVASGSPALVTAAATNPGASGASAGKAFVFWGSTHLASPGQYRGQVVVAVPSSSVFPGGFVQTAPSDQPYTVVIHARV